MRRFVFVITLVLILICQLPVAATESWLQEKIDRVYVVRPLPNGWLPWDGLIARAYWLPLQKLRVANLHVKDWNHLRAGDIVWIPRRSTTQDHVLQSGHWLAQFKNPNYRLWITQMLGYVRGQKTVSIKEFSQLTQPATQPSGDRSMIWLGLIIIISLVLLLIASSLPNNLTFSAGQGGTLIRVRDQPIPPPEPTELISEYLLVDYRIFIPADQIEFKLVKAGQTDLGIRPIIHGLAGSGADISPTSLQRIEVELSRELGRAGHHYLCPNILVPYRSSPFKLICHS